MVRSGIALVAVVLATAACGGSEKEAERPGEASVYAEIDAETDCAELQATFDRNMGDVERRQEADANDPIIDVVLSYAKAADERMAEVGCYDDE